MREVISIHVGQAGCQIGNSAWEVRKTTPLEISQPPKISPSQSAHAAITSFSLMLMSVALLS